MTNAVATAATSELVVVGPALAIAVVVMTAVSLAVTALAGTNLVTPIAVATARALVQLVLLGLTLAAVMDSLLLCAAFVALIAVVSSTTAARRIVGARPRVRYVAITATAVAAPALLLTGGLIAGGVIPLRPISIIPIAGIVMGGSMTAAGLAGMRARQELGSRWGEFEAGLALGLTPTFVRFDIIRASAATGLLPTLDQTRTVGLVAIPGTFVGMMLGGASPASAAVVQLLVLVAIACCGSIAVALITRYLAMGWFGEFRPAH